MNCSENHNLNKCSQQIGVEVDSVHRRISVEPLILLSSARCSIKTVATAMISIVKPFNSPSGLRTVDEAVFNIVLSPISEKVPMLRPGRHIAYHVIVIDSGLKQLLG